MIVEECVHVKVRLVQNIRKGVGGVAKGSSHKSKKKSL